MADPILREGAHVTLDVGGDTAMLPCRIVGLTGDELALLPLRPPDPPTWRKLSMRGEVVVLFDSQGQTRALRGNASGVRAGGFLAVRLTDEFRLGQRRRHSRAPLEFRVELVDPEDGDAWTSVTLDMSAAGMRVQRPDVDAPARTGTATLALPERPIVARASLVQAAPDWLSYRLDDLAPEPRERLAALVLAYHRKQLGTGRSR